MQEGWLVVDRVSAAVVLLVRSREAGDVYVAQQPEWIAWRLIVRVVRYRRAS